MDILDLIYPRRCLECGEKGKYICNTCLGKVGKGLYSNRLISIWQYDGVIRRAIIALKYKFASDVAEELAERIVTKLLNYPPTQAGWFTDLLKNAVLMPIPLHSRRERWRGFNQSEEIGKLIVQKMGWEFLPDLLIKKTATKPQVGLRGNERKSNVKDVFVLNPNHKSLFFNHKSLIIFDDVWTTGATLTEASKVLKKRGAKEIMGLTITR